MQNKINEIFKGDNMENSNQIEAPVKFGILEEEKVSRKFYPVKMPLPIQCCRKGKQQKAQVMTSCYPVMCA